MYISIFDTCSHTLSFQRDRWWANVDICTLCTQKLCTYCSTVLDLVCILGICFCLSQTWCLFLLLPCEKL